MAVWERYDGGVSHTAEGSISNLFVFNNEEDTDNFQSADIFVVDGLITLHTDTDDLMGVRLLILPDSVTPTSEDQPKPHERSVYYQWFTARGPVVHRLRSKKTIPAEYRMYMQIWKASGTTATTLRYGLQLLLQMKH